MNMNICMLMSIKCFVFKQDNKKKKLSLDKEKLIVPKSDIDMLLIIY